MDAIAGVLQEILRAFARIPDVVWSGVIASLITMSGVLLSNRGNSKRFEKQLAHESNERVLERRSAIRKEVFLRGAEEIVKANRHFAVLPYLPIATLSKSDGLAGFFESAMKLQLVCGVETAVLVGELTARYGELLLVVLPKLLPIGESGTRAEICQANWERSSSDAKRLLTKFQAMAESGAEHFPDLKEVEVALQQALATMNEAQAQWDAASALQTNLRIALSRELMGLMKPVNEAQSPVMGALRREIGLGMDEGKFQEMLESNLVRMTTALDEALAQIPQ